ncbi:Major facilitator superfamily,Major facilitator superfamily domain [Cinara cedri]|uniref:Sialin n=1 Tax=Cinara cedri TaxID=506608 RepID=A0A5E4N4Y0_9HEMI|nr:Major facilitator superfamily,Major facilitator superfamily domain [Cinara cedri]
MEPSDNKSDGQKPFWKKRRNLITFMVFLGFVNVFMLRVNLSVGIVTMTTPKDSKTIAEFDWDSKVRGAILSAFFYGYVCTQLIGGTLAAKFGGVKLMGYGVLGTAIFTVLTPMVTRHSVYLIIIFRVVEGVFEGISYPAVHAIWSNWIPPAERVKLTSLAFSGCFTAMFIGYPVCGWLADNYGWSSIFYVPGFVAITWCIVWLMFVGESPKEDKYICEEERKYIVDSIGPTDNKIISFSKYPWKDIFTSIPVWAINIAHFCSNWGVYTLLTQLPSYMNDVLKLNIGQGSLVSGLPYIAITFTIQINGFFVHWLRKKEILTATQMRKIFNTIAFVSQAVFLYVTANSTTKIGSVIYLTLSECFGGLIWAGYMTNHLEVAPQYASLLLGISNTFGTLPGIISPMLTGIIVRHQSADEWRLVFLITSGIYLTGAIVYAVFSSGELQPWAKVEVDKRDDADKRCDTGPL